MNNDLVLRGVTKQFGEHAAVRDVSVEIAQGSFFSFLGPSGCGKTTILRMISGFIDPSAGQILLAGRDLLGIAPNRRPTALIFQNLALFPLMSVADNISYGLRVRGASAAARSRKVDEMLDLVSLRGYATNRVDELSGGQRQRVAIARALAVEPAVLLLDEPLSALDLKLRQHMRTELRALQRRAGITFIYITHDQGEALAMSDRIAVMSQGRIEQVGRSAEIYDAPATAFVASFVGENNMLTGRLARLDGDHAVLETPLGPMIGRNEKGLGVGEEAMLFIRPDRMRLAPIENADATNRIDGDIVEVVFEGSATVASLRHSSGRIVRIALANDGSGPPPVPGTRHGIVFAAGHGLILPNGAMARLETER
jgi:spermidine/putrescine transport system ATP-binding protein